MFAKHTAALRSSVATPAGLLHTAEKPSGLVVEPRLLLIPLHNIEAHAELELAQAHRTKVQRASVTFLQMIRPIHQTTEIDTVCQPEHVAGFVRQHLHAPAQNQLLIILSPSLAEKGRVVPRKTVNTHARSERRLAKNEVPGRFRIKILHRDRQDAESVSGQLSFQPLQNIPGQNLLSSCHRVGSAGKAAGADANRVSTSTSI